MPPKRRYRVIPFRPGLARIFGDIPSAIYYAQLWYWRNKGRRPDGYIYKSKLEIEQETTLTREQQDRIRKKLVGMGWLDVKLWRANGHATFHYKCLREPIVSDYPAQAYAEMSSE